jgi:hypothetical protein
MTFSRYGGKNAPYQKSCMHYCTFLICVTDFHLKKLMQFLINVTQSTSSSLLSGMTRLPPKALIDFPRRITADIGFVKFNTEVSIALLLNPRFWLPSSVQSVKFEVFLNLKQLQLLTSELCSQ